MSLQIIGVIAGVILIMLAASLVCWITETDELE